MIDRRKTILNFTTNFIFKIIILIISFINRKYLLVLGTTAVGIYDLYLSIIVFLQIVELGVSSSLIYMMYHPISCKDISKVRAFYCFLKNFYKTITLITLLLGILALPLLNIFIEDMTISIYYNFLILLASFLITYLYTGKTSLLEAYKNNYIVSIVTNIINIIICVVQIIILIYYPNMTLFLICKVIGSILSLIIINIVCSIKYKDIISQKEYLNNGEQKIIIKNLKAMLMHKIGGTLVLSMDKILISFFFSVSFLAIFSNYNMIVSSSVSIITIALTSLSSVIGHLIISNDYIKIHQKFKQFYLICYYLNILLFLGLFSISSDFILLYFGNEFVLNDKLVLIIITNAFIGLNRISCLIFRDSTGLYYYDRYKSVLEGICNVILSIILVHVFDIYGLILSTIITNLLICHIVEPYILYKHLFKRSLKKYLVSNYLYIIIFILSLGVFNIFKVNNNNAHIKMLFNLIISQLIGISIIVCVFLLNKRSDKIENNN